MFEPPASVLTADRFEDAMLDQIGTQRRHGPPPLRPAQRRGRPLSTSLYRGVLSRGETLRCATSAHVVYRCHAVVAARMESSSDGRGMHVQQLRDVDGGQARGGEPDGFSPAALSGGECLFEPCV